VTPLLWPHGTSTVLGIDLKCSESVFLTTFTSAAPAAHRSYLIIASVDCRFG
jgi:hypothetical protein